MTQCVFSRVEKNAGRKGLNFRNCAHFPECVFSESEWINRGIAFIKRVFTRADDEFSRSRDPIGMSHTRAWIREPLPVLTVRILGWTRAASAKAKWKFAPNQIQRNFLSVVRTYRGRPGLAACFRLCYYRWWTWGDLENCATVWVPVSGGARAEDRRVRGRDKWIRQTSS